VHTRKIVYFEEGGAEHTDTLIDVVKEAAADLGVKKVVVASTSGDSAVRVAEKFIGTGVNIVAVGHQSGFPTPGQRFKVENMEKLRSLGVDICLSTDVLTNSIRQKERLGASPLSIITQMLSTLKMKVNIEVVLKATDGGYVTPGERVISLAGSHSGLDTAIVFEAQESAKILDLKLGEIIAIPLSREKSDAEYMKKRAAQATSQ
jgi:uncharacterized protein